MCKIREVVLKMKEQKKYEVIKSLADHEKPNKLRAAGPNRGSPIRRINRMLAGYKENGIISGRRT